MKNPRVRKSSADTSRWKLTAKDVSISIDPGELGFGTTAELEPLHEVVGQERAIRALELGLGVRHRGYNLYVSGLMGTGRKHLLQRLLEARATTEATPDDWVYVNNFDAADSPLALRLPGGQGVVLRRAMEQIMDRVQRDLPVMLKAKDFDTERNRLTAEYAKRADELFNGLVDRANRLEMAVHRLPNGAIDFVPRQSSQPMEAGAIEQLDEDEQSDIIRRKTELERAALGIMAEQQELSYQLQIEIGKTVRAFSQRIVDPLIARAKIEFPGVALTAWLDRVRDHMLDHLDRFEEKEESSDAEPDWTEIVREALQRDDPWMEYRVNVVADNARTQGAPVVMEISPSYKNLFGTIEHDVNLLGRVSTDFTRIKPGSLLRASGGYLVLDLEDAVTEPLVWKQLKRTLESGQLLTDIYEPLGLFATSALKPQPIPIDTKLVVIGPEELYYTLQYVDEDFRELFKVRADFGPEMPRDAESQRAYARFVAREAQEEGLPPFEAGAVAEIIRFGVRQVEHRGRLSSEFGTVADVVRESGFWARREGATVVNARHVQRALDERVYRSNRIGAKILDLIEDGTLRISVDGSRIGQINGLTLWDVGDFCFGRPTRVSASVGVGQEGLINIERESDLSGSTHDKGVLILEGYLRNRYAAAHPLALSASLAFEQSYGWIEGDSASAAELYCLLSALGGVPLRQDIAVTGSVNQHGEIQAVGGVNDKIEGFFDVCRVLGLTGTQGVCIPRTNLLHLALRDEVIDAIRQDRFHVWAVDSIDEGIELLTGRTAGDVDRKGTFHHQVDQRLQEILAMLDQRPTAIASPKVRIGTGAPPKPSPPRLPGDRG